MPVVWHMPRLRERAMYKAAEELFIMHPPLIFSLPFQLLPVLGPGFPKRGCQPPEFWANNYCFVWFLPKIHENERIGERNGPGVFLVPLWIRQCFWFNFYCRCEGRWTTSGPWHLLRDDWRKEWRNGKCGTFGCRCKNTKWDLIGKNTLCWKLGKFWLISKFWFRVL